MSMNVPSSGMRPISIEVIFAEDFDKENEVALWGAFKSSIDRLRKAAADVGYQPKIKIEGILRISDQWSDLSDVAGKRVSYNRYEYDKSGS